MKRIFLVEDDAAIAKNLTRLLCSEGFHVVCAATQQEAFAMLAEQRFDLSLAAGIPLSLIISALSVKTMTTDDVKFTLPWASVGISTFSVFLVIFVTMMYAVSKIKKENIIDALRDEMT